VVCKGVINMDIKKMTSSKTVIVLVLLIILTLSILGVIVAGKRQSQPVIKEQSEVDTSIIFEKMEKISELSIMKYYYSDVVVYKNNKKLKEFDIPFTQKSFLIKYDGYIKAGIEAGSIRIVSNDDEGIKLIIKNSKILDHVIDENSLYVYDEKSSLFNKLSLKDVVEQIVSEKSNVENGLIEKGFLREADNNLKMYLEGSLKDLGFERVEVYFEAE
jgi:hypothetical protein